MKPLAVLAVACAVLAVMAPPAVAQALTTRGFVEGWGTWFPQDAPNDTVNLVGDFRGREEVFVDLAEWLQLAGGVEVRANSHDQVSDSWAIDFHDRGFLRPALAIRRLSATVARGPYTFDLGKQFLRWGKTDIVTPTDRFAPRDFLDVVNSEFLAVTGARFTWQTGADTIEAAWVPVFTPSRMPLLDQRWTVQPAPGVTLVDAGAIYPERFQAGVRWSRMGGGLEYALTFFDGFNHLPNILGEPGSTPLEFAVQRRYPALRMYGGDLALPSRWFTLKAEAGYFTSSDSFGDEYVLYVVQLERQTGEWVLTGGYAGEVVTEHRSGAAFAPDRGLARSITARASYTIDPNRTAAIETALRADGVYVRGEYSWTRGQHWRTTIAGAFLAGDPTDFIGQYEKNSHTSLTLRYSF